MRLTLTKFTLLISVAGGFTLIFLISTHMLNGDQTKNGNSWFMEYRVIHDAPILHENRSVLIIVTTAPGNLNKRNDIRGSWGSWPHVRVVFIMGVPANYNDGLQRSIKAEVSTYGDIVQMDFKDNYRNLTLKTCACVMWAVRNSWRERKLVIKTDDDMCVDIPLLTSTLPYFNEGIYGNPMKLIKPFRCNRTACSKWGLTLEEYSEPMFPPYILGAFYAIEERALKKLHEKLFVPKFLFIEDVYLTGLVARAANVSIASMPKGIRVNGFQVPANWKQRDDIVAQHNCHGKFQHEFWDHTRTRSRSSQATQKPAKRG